MTHSLNRAYHLEKPGSLGGLVLSEQPIPSPGLGQVLVRVRASAINYRDIMIVKGMYPVPVPADRVPLSDGAGEVIALGEGVTRFKTGDAVVNIFSPIGSAARSTRCPSNG